MSSLPVNVVNFDELKELLTLEAEQIVIDTTRVEESLEKYFPEIIELLRSLSSAGGGSVAEDGIQKVTGERGYANQNMSFVFDEDVLITGITFSQSKFDGATDDYWTVKITGNGESLTIIDKCCAKDTIMHKYFETFYPVPAGYEILIKPYSDSAKEKVFFVDLEYLCINSG